MYNNSRNLDNSTDEDIFFTYSMVITILCFLFAL